MRASSRTSARARARERKRQQTAPVRMPGLHYDTFEAEEERHEGAYGTDRAPTYQSRYAAEHPRRYVRKFLNWLRGKPARGRTRYKRKARPAAKRRRARAQ
jgi:hypothetical protein